MPLRLLVTSLHCPAPTLLMQPQAPDLHPASPDDVVRAPTPSVAVSSMDLDAAARDDSQPLRSPTSGLATLCWLVVAVIVLAVVYFVIR